MKRSRDDLKDIKPLLAKESDEEKKRVWSEINDYIDFLFNESDGYLDIFQSGPTKVNSKEKTFEFEDGTKYYIGFKRFKGTSNLKI